MTQGTIFDIKRYAIHDGPGIRTTIFFKVRVAGYSDYFCNLGIDLQEEVIARTAHGDL